MSTQGYDTCLNRGSDFRHLQDLGILAIVLGIVLGIAFRLPFSMPPEDVLLLGLAGFFLLQRSFVKLINKFLARSSSIAPLDSEMAPASISILFLAYFPVKLLGAGVAAVYGCAVILPFLLCFHFGIGYGRDIP